jgi:hypothetical protein
MTNEEGQVVLDWQAFHPQSHPELYEVSDKYSQAAFK